MPRGIGAVWLERISPGAEQKAIAEYEKFNKQQRIESDFDREVKKLLQKRDTEK